MLKAISDFLNPKNEETDEEHNRSVETILQQVLSQLSPQEKNKLTSHMNTETGTSATDALQQLISHLKTHVSSNAHQLQDNDTDSTQKFSDNLHNAMGGIFGVLLTKVLGSESDSGTTKTATETTTSTQFAGIGSLLQKVLPLLITATMTHATKNVNTNADQLSQVSNKLTDHLSGHLQETLSRRGVEDSE